MNSPPRFLPPRSPPPCTSVRAAPLRMSVLPPRDHHLLMTEATLTQTEGEAIQRCRLLVTGLGAESLGRRQRDAESKGERKLGESIVQWKDFLRPGRLLPLQPPLPRTSQLTPAEFVT